MFIHLEKYCPCSRSTPVESSSVVVKKLTTASIDHINEVKLKNHKHLCMPLELRQIIRAEVEEIPAPKPTKSNPKPVANFTHLYTVLYELAPSGGTFEGRVFYHETTGHLQVNSDILRINLYGQTSACIQDKYELRSFCYCISYHQKLNKLQTSATIEILASNQTATISTNLTKT